MFRLSACILFITCQGLISAPVEVTPKELREGVQPQLAISPEGTIHLTFGLRSAIYHTRSKDGRTFTPPVRIAELEKLALGMRRGPRIVATDGTVCVTAISHASGTLHSWLSTDEGQTWKDQGSLNSAAKSAREGMHGMSSNGRGLTALAWLDLRSGKTELWSRVSQDGGVHWGPEMRVYASPDGTICECCHPTVSVSSAGEIGVVWRNWLNGSRDMWGTVSLDGGRTFSGASKLGTGTWPLKGCPMDGGSATYDHHGKLLTVWRRESTVYSAALGSEETVIASEAFQPVIARTRDGTVVAYEQKGETHFWSVPNRSQSVGRGKAPAIGSDANGKVFLAWESPDRGILIMSLASLE